MAATDESTGVIFMVDAWPRPMAMYKNLSEFLRREVTGWMTLVVHVNICESNQTVGGCISTHSSWGWGWEIPGPF